MTKRTEVNRVPTGEFEPCPGEAHSNPFIDNCGLCAPRWGTRPTFHPVDMVDAKAKRLDVPVRFLTSEQLAAVESGTDATLVMVTRKRGRNEVSYFVVRWLRPAAKTKACRICGEGDKRDCACGPVRGY